MWPFKKRNINLKTKKDSSVNKSSVVDVPHAGHCVTIVPKCTTNAPGHCVTIVPKK